MRETYTGIPFHIIMHVYVMIIHDSELDMLKELF